MTLSPVWLFLLLLLVPLPFATDRRGRRVPWATYTLIGLNVLAYLFTGPGTFTRWGLTPGAPHYHALLTYQFLHRDLGHLAGNMAFLWLFGPHVEEALGWEAFLALYLGGGIAAGLLHMAIVIIRGEFALGPLVGASGAISAILAPFAIRFHRAQIRLVWLPGLLAERLSGRRGWGFLEVPALLGLGLWLGQNVWEGVLSLKNPNVASGGTAYWAHLGGFAFGLIAAELTGLLRDGRQEYLLQDARTAASWEAAVRGYRTFLSRAPENAPVRGELAALLARHDEENEAVRELTLAVREALRQGTAEAVHLMGEALALGLPLALTPRERLRLAGAAEAAGDVPVAVCLLRALLAETPEAPEDGMARLKLGQLLRDRDPAAALAALAGFLEKYPRSEWVHRARELQALISADE